MTITLHTHKSRLPRIFPLTHAVINQTTLTPQWAHCSSPFMIIDNMEVNHLNTWYINRLSYYGAAAFCHKYIERHTAHTIVSWPNPKQWIIVHNSDLMMVIRQSIYSDSSQGKWKWVNRKHTAPYIVWWITERMRLILLTQPTKYPTCIL